MRLLCLSFVLSLALNAHSENVALFESQDATNPVQYGWVYRDIERALVMTPENSTLTGSVWTEFQGQRRELQLLVAQPQRGYQIYTMTGAPTLGLLSWKQWQSTMNPLRRNQEIQWGTNGGFTLAIGSQRHRYLAPLTVTEVSAKETLQSQDVGRAVYSKCGQLMGFVSNLAYVEQPGSQSLMLPLRDFHKEARRFAMMTWGELEHPESPLLPWRARNDQGWWIDAGRFEFQEKCEWKLRQPNDGPIGGADGWGIGGADGWGIGGLRTMSPCSILVRAAPGLARLNPDAEQTWLQSLKDQPVVSLEFSVQFRKEAKASERFEVRRWQGLSDLLKSFDEAHPSQLYPVSGIHAERECQKRVRSTAQELQTLLKENFDQLPKVSLKMIFVHFILRTQLAESSHWRLLRDDAFYELPREIAPVFWNRDLEPSLDKKVDDLIWELKQSSRDCRD